MNWPSTNTNNDGKASGQQNSLLPSPSSDIMDDSMPILHHESDYTLNIPGTVMLVHGLNINYMNCNSLFNLLCQYGNVYRMKFIKPNRGLVMVQMTDPNRVRNVFKYLQGAVMFSNAVYFTPSKQDYMYDLAPGQGFKLKDRSPSYVDYRLSPFNRFRTPEEATRNRLSPPTSVLFFRNVPKDFSEEDIYEIFKFRGCRMPVAIKMFGRNPESKTVKGLLNFTSIALATEALVLRNHLKLYFKNDRTPYFLKLCFSTSKFDHAGNVWK